MVYEARLDFLALRRQREPGLEPGEPRTALDQSGRGALGVDDPPACRHPVHGSRSNILIEAETVSMSNGAFDEIRRGRETDVEVGSDVETLTAHE